MSAKRVTMEQLEQLAFQSHGAIEVDEAEGVAVLELKNGRTYYASLPAAVRS